MVGDGIVLRLSCTKYALVMINGREPDALHQRECGMRWRGETCGEGRTASDGSDDSWQIIFSDVIYFAVYPPMQFKHYFPSFEGCLLG